MRSRLHLWVVAYPFAGALRVGSCGHCLGGVPVASMVGSKQQWDHVQIKKGVVNGSVTHLSMYPRGCEAGAY